MRPGSKFRPYQREKKNCPYKVVAQFFTFVPIKSIVEYLYRM